MYFNPKFQRVRRSFRKSAVQPFGGIFRLVFFTVLVLAACSTNDEIVIRTVSPMSPPSRDSVRSDENCNLGFCFTVIENNTDIHDWRFIDVVLNTDDFSVDKITGVVRFLSKQYTEPKQMAVTVATDPKFFTQATHSTYYVKMAYYSRRVNGKEKLEYTESIPTQVLTEIDLEP